MKHPFNTRYKYSLESYVFRDASKKKKRKETRQNSYDMYVLPILLHPLFFTICDDSAREGDINETGTH
jgi:hypothetical protein